MLCTQRGFSPELCRVNVRATRAALWPGICTAFTPSSDPAPCGLARCRNDTMPAMTSTPARVSSRILTGGRLRLAVPNSSPMRMVGPRCGAGGVRAAGAPGVGCIAGVSSGIDLPVRINSTRLTYWSRLPAPASETGLRVRALRVLSRELGHDFQSRVAAVPDLLSRSAGHNDAAFGGGSGRVDAIAVHEESAAAQCVGARCRQRQHKRPVLRGVNGWSRDGPVTLRNGADIGNRLHRGIVLAVVTPGIAGSHELA